MQGPVSPAASRLPIYLGPPHTSPDNKHLPIDRLKLEGRPTVRAGKRTGHCHNSGASQPFDSQRLWPDEALRAGFV